MVDYQPIFRLWVIIFSIICRNNKQNNNPTGAENMIRLALFFNLIITIGEIIAWTIFIIYISIYRTVLHSLTYVLGDKPREKKK
jgi:hypothetical protein